MAKLLSSVARTVLAVLLVLAALLCLLSLSARQVYQPSRYSAAANDAFYDALYVAVQDHLQSEALFYGIPYETLQQGVTKQTVRAAVEPSIASVYGTLRGENNTADIALSAEPFRAAIQAYFDGLPVEERPLDPKAAETIAKELVKSTALVAASGIGDRTLKLAKPFFADSALPKQVADGFWWFVAVLGVLTVVSILPLGRSWRERLQGTAGSLFIGTALAAVPAFLFARLDFPSKLVIGESALREYVCALLYGLIDSVRTITLTAFIVMAVLLVITTVILSLMKKTDQPDG